MASTKKNQAGINNVEVTYPINDFSQLKIAGNLCSQKAENAFSETLYFKIVHRSMPRTCLEACTFGARDWPHK